MINRLKIFALMLFGASIISCSDVLDIEPVNSIPQSRAFESLDDIEQGIIGAYGIINEQILIGVSSRASDDTRLSPENRGQGVQIHSWTYVSTNTEMENIWLNTYSTIAQINRVLNGLNNLVNGGVISESEASAPRGELLALRAFMHFELFRAAGDYTSGGTAIPYITLQDLDGNGVPDGLETFGQPVRQSTSDFYNLLFADIDDAKSLVPASFGLDNTSRMNYYAIRALEARAGLYAQDYNRAISGATDVIDAVALADSTEYRAIWTDEGNTEVLFELARVSGDGRIGTLWQDTNGDVFFAPSDEVISIYDPINDVRYPSFILIDGDRDGEPELVNKYPGKPALDKLNDIKIFRVSEMYLIRAEAYARSSTPDIAAANSDLQDIKDARLTNYIPSDINDVNALLDEILLERRKELAFEGHRFFDLKRFGFAIDRLPTDCELSSACELPAGNFRFNLPIPQSEIFANDNMVQNDGYTSN
ncbi:RagB/SusD family nutrient uptake outer membrane protein [Mangrovivirga cuniculi]|uniref:RagB/SusD family nutrient uptake outer membrane protein n=1 Tax=Mangrovivirga cuniculi TaxID=2715131 RepID=A0A4D7JHE2_9BACT|nr:RagB/SusD family nutrient uptake outer membrane protein [Mangrovivirga cuniculi]QCK14117.1 hypothetical protein DCC35_04810 [Mangrovivirga cuniculi]